MANNGFHIEKRRPDVDVLRSYNWEVTIPDISPLTDGILSVDDVIIRSKSISIPGRGNEIIEVNWKGMKQLFPGKPTFGSNTVIFAFYEYEDQKISTGLKRWQDKVFNVNPNDPNGGASTVNKKRDIARDLIITSSKYNKENVDFSFKLWNAWIQNVDDIALDYTSQDSVGFQATFAFDYITVEKSQK